MYKLYNNWMIVHNLVDYLSRTGQKITWHGTDLSDSGRNYEQIIINYRNWGFWGLFKPYGTTTDTSKLL